MKHLLDIANIWHFRHAKRLNLVLILAVLLFCLAEKPAIAQVQCLIPKNDKNGLLLVKNNCNLDIVLEVKIDNSNFSDHRCFSSKSEVYPCRELVVANSKVQIEVPIGELQGGYRACYRLDVGTPVCEFK